MLPDGIEPALETRFVEQSRRLPSIENQTKNHRTQ